MKKKFKLGFIVGRFQMLHKGHEQLIDMGLSMCERFIILLGSSNEYRTEKNPFTFEERKEMIKTIYGDKAEAYPIINIGIGYVPEWGQYLINTIKFYTGKEPDFAIIGSEIGRENWLPQYHGMSIFTVSRDIIKTYATDVRESILKNGNSSQISKKYKKSQLEKWQKILLDVRRGNVRWTRI